MLEYLAKITEAEKERKGECHEIEETVKVKRDLYTCSCCGNEFIEEPKTTKDLR